MLQPKAWDAFLELLRFRKPVDKGSPNGRQEFNFRAAATSVTMPTIEDLSEETLVGIIDDSEIAARYKLRSVDFDPNLSRGLFRSRHLFSTDNDSNATAAALSSALASSNYDSDSRRSSGLMPETEANIVRNPILKENGGRVSSTARSFGGSSFGFGFGSKRTKSSGVKFSLDDDKLDDDNL